jgi:myo-inositol-1-phosphate synthase
MHIKINFQCRDSILAAPIVLDLALLGDLAKRAGEQGPQEWLSFFFKSPVVAPGHAQLHDLFRQQDVVHRQLRRYAEALGTVKALSARG